MNTIQHLNSIIPVYRLTGYKVTVTTRLSAEATRGWRTASGPASQATAVGQQRGTWRHPQSQSQGGVFCSKAGSGCRGKQKPRCSRAGEGGNTISLRSAEESLTLEERAERWVRDENSLKTPSETPVQRHDLALESGEALR